MSKINNLHYFGGLFRVLQISSNINYPVKEPDFVLLLIVTPEKISTQSSIIFKFEYTTTDYFGPIYLNCDFVYPEYFKRFLKSL